MPGPPSGTMTVTTALEEVNKHLAVTASKKDVL
jgi:hypothetical protein